RSQARARGSARAARDSADRRRRVWRALLRRRSPETREGIRHERTRSELQFVLEMSRTRLPARLGRGWTLRSRVAAAQSHTLPRDEHSDPERYCARAASGSLRGASRALAERAASASTRDVGVRAQALSAEPSHHGAVRRLFSLGAAR